MLPVFFCVFEGPAEFLENLLPMIGLAYRRRRRENRDKPLFGLPTEPHGSLFSSDFFMSSIIVFYELLPARKKFVS